MLTHGTASSLIARSPPGLVAGHLRGQLHHAAAALRRACARYRSCCSRLFAERQRYLHALLTCLSPQEGCRRDGREVHGFEGILITSSVVSGEGNIASYCSVLTSPSTLLLLGYEHCSYSLLGFVHLSFASVRHKSPYTCLFTQSTTLVISGGNVRVHNLVYPTVPSSRCNWISEVRLRLH